MSKRGRGLKILRIAAGAAVFMALAVAFSGIFPPASRASRSQLFPAVLNFFSTYGVFLAGVLLFLHLGAALLWGRLYCSFCCPLGFLQDIAGRLGRLCRFPRFYREQPDFRLLRRVVLLFVLGLVAGGGLILAGWIDPYSLFGRMASETAARSAEMATAGEFDPVRPFSAARGGAVLGFMLLILLAASRRGRIFCNTLCPVGAGLGLLAKRAAFPPGIGEKCIGCGRCVKVCKSGCIDLKRRTIDVERCVQCFNCESVCPVGAAAHRARPAYQGRLEAPPGEPDSGRRKFLALSVCGAAAGFSVGRGVLKISSRGSGAKIPVMPPGAMSLEAFADRCTGYGLCIANCPGKTLEAATTEYSWSGFGRPFLSTAHGFCDYNCRRCAEICPVGALRKMPLAEKRRWKIGSVRYFRERCVVVTDHTDCGACAEHCPTGALRMVPYGNEGLTIPEVHPELCIGCGGCEYICPVRPLRAVRVDGVAYQSRAAIGKSPSKPRRPSVVSAGKADFPF